MRTFLALDLDPAFRDAAAGLQTTLLPHLGKAKPRWVAPSLLHLTLRFFGETTAEQAAGVRAFVDALLPIPLPLEAQTLAAFPQPRRARILALALTSTDALANIAAQAEQTARTLGFPPEDRTFRPHLTLARLREPSDLRSAISSATAALSGHATAIVYYESVLGRDGPTYTALASCLLG